MLAYFKSPNNPVNSVRFKLELLSVSKVLKLSETFPIASVLLIASSLLASNKLKRLVICCTVEFELNELNKLAACVKLDVLRSLTLLQLVIAKTTATDNITFFIIKIDFQQM